MNPGVIFLEFADPRTLLAQREEHQVMKPLRLLAILYPRLAPAGHPSPSSDSIPLWYVALVVILMFFTGLVFLVAGLQRWHAVRKRRRNRSGWHRASEPYRWSGRARGGRSGVEAWMGWLGSKFPARKIYDRSPFHSSSAREPSSNA